MTRHGSKHALATGSSFDASRLISFNSLTKDLCPLSPLELGRIGGAVRGNVKRGGLRQALMPPSRIPRKSPVFLLVPDFSILKLSTRTPIYSDLQCSGERNVTRRWGGVTAIMMHLCLRSVQCGRAHGTNHGTLSSNLHDQGLRFSKTIHWVAFRVLIPTEGGVSSPESRPPRLTSIPGLKLDPPEEQAPAVLHESWVQGCAVHRHRSTREILRQE